MKTRLAVYVVSLLLILLCIQGVGRGTIHYNNLPSKSARVEVLAEDPEPVSEIEFVESGNGGVPGFGPQEKWGTGLIPFSISGFRYCYQNSLYKRLDTILPQRYLQHIYPSHFFW